MTEILSQVDNGTNDDNPNYIIIDVRGQEEIMMGTGLMSDNIQNIPLPQISMMNAFEMDEKSFESQFFQTEYRRRYIGVYMSHSAQAAQLAQQSGYKSIINYTGGADEWFGGEFVYS